MKQTAKQTMRAMPNILRNMARNVMRKKMQTVMRTMIQGITQGVQQMRMQVRLGIVAAGIVMLLAATVLATSASAFTARGSMNTASSSQSQASSSSASTSAHSTSAIVTPGASTSDSSTPAPSRATATPGAKPTPAPSSPPSTTAKPTPPTASSAVPSIRKQLALKPIPYPSQQEWQHLKSTGKSDGIYPQVSGNGNLTYHNGPVQHTPTTYVIFWGSSWTGADSGTASIVQSYFNDLSGTSFENILSQYYDTNGYIQDSEGFNSNHVYFDTSAPPTDSTCGAGYPTIEDSSLQTEVNNAIAAKGWARDSSNGLYLVYTPNGDYVYNSGLGCNAPVPNGTWCAYHSYSGSDSVAYAAMPYPGQNTQGGCLVPYAPNGNEEGDSEVNLQSHEEFETISDPQLDAWYDAAGYEIGDKCAWTFPSGNGTTTLNNGGTFEMQMEYSNASSNCVNAYSGSTPSPSISSFTPTSGPPGTSVTISGSNFVGTTAVSFNGTGASYAVNSASQITATVPTGATTGPISVTTPGGTATSSSSFTVNTLPATTNSVIENGGFEGGDNPNGSLYSWTTAGTTAISHVAHSGRSAAMLGSTNPTNGDSSISQQFILASPTTQLSFWYLVDCPDDVAYDWATATVFDATTSTTTTVLPPTCNTNNTWAHVSADLSAMAGHTVILTLTSHDDDYPADPTYTLYDDVTLLPTVVNPVVNSSFEGSTLDNDFGDLSGWALSGTGGLGGPGHTGATAAVVGWDTPTNGNNTLNQTFTIPNGASTLNLWYLEVCQDTVSNDWATVTLHDNTANTTTTLLPNTCTENGTWTQVSASVASLGGHSVTLNLIDHDDNVSGTATYTFFDDVLVS